ncbi:MAG: ATP-binding cassette domain-containing protein [Gammaproteobacteria bacterium]|nr:ATP-binding cassette domain-containing protein [Gammaproteobacteria bacterium]
MPVPAVTHIELERIGKRFGATQAVDRANLKVERGTIHALVGENGAGKSTLGKIIAGVLPPDEGVLKVSGRPVVFRSPRHALEHGITTIAQELSLVPARTVLENVFLGIEDHAGPVVLRSVLQRRYEDLVQRSGIGVPRERLVRFLTIAEQQKVEILRALARQADLIFMDEPTARLSTSEAEHLHAVVRRLKESGTTVVFVSHLLDEVLALADVVTIMRDGQIVRTGPTSEETHDSLIEAMIGRRLESTFPPKQLPPIDSPEVLRVEGLTRRGAFRDVSFTVRRGEIVVLAGLVGSGRSEVARAVFGADGYDSGSVWIDGSAQVIRSPGDAIANGIAMVPESRKDQGLVPARSVRENVTLPHLGRFSRFGIIDGTKEVGQCRALIEAVEVRGASTESVMRSLSGGNQQKTLFARWLLHRPRILIADEPTRGVDVGAKRAIYALLIKVAQQGSAVLIISSELEEVMGMAHRILVMREGRIVEEIDANTATEEEVVGAAFGTGTGVRGK